MLFLIYLVLFLLFIFILQLRHWASPRTIWLMRKFKGPKGLPFLGISLELGQVKGHDLLDYFWSYMCTYGRGTVLWVMGLPHIYLQEPEDLEVAMGSVLYIHKGEEYRLLEPWLKEGLLVSTGAKWHKRRKMLTPAFHFRILEDSLQTMNKNSLLLVEKIFASNTDQVDVESFVTLCSLDIICESVMGVSLGAQQNEGKGYVKSIKRICQLIVQRQISFWMYRPWMFYIVPTGFEFRKVLSVLHKFTDKVIADRKNTFAINVERQTTKSHKTRMAFLDSMIEYEAKNPGSLTTSDIREEVDTFMFEGHDTTSSAILFTMFLLGTHQDVQEKVYEELHDIFGDSDRGVEMKDLPKMVYLEKVLKETLRLYPSVPYIARYLTNDLKLDGMPTIPAGTNVVIMPYWVHRNPRFYPDPEKFDPERFSEEAILERHPYAYIPFSAGARNCIGQKYAMMELKVTLSTVLRRARLESVTKREDFGLVPFLILRPTAPIKIKFIPRT